MFLLDCASSKYASERIPIENHLHLHSWMISPEAHLNWSYPTGDHNRIKICFSWMAQVRNLPIGLFFPSEYGLKIHSWIVSSESHLNFVLAKMVPTTESKSVACTVPVQVRNMPVTTLPFYRNMAALKIHSWMASWEVLNWY